MPSSRSVRPRSGRSFSLAKMILSLLSSLWAAQRVPAGLAKHPRVGAATAANGKDQKDKPFHYEFLGLTHPNTATEASRDMRGDGGSLGCSVMRCLTHPFGICL